jgi:hypothetical protein
MEAGKVRANIGITTAAVGPSLFYIYPLKGGDPDGHDQKE